MIKLAAISAGVIVSAATLLAGTGFGIATGSKTYTLNNAIAQNSITFLSDAPAEKIKGSANKVTGSFAMDASNLEATNGKIIVEVGSMTTAVSKRDEHMYSDAWLNKDAYPTITFDVKSLTNVKVDKSNGRNTATATAVGTFTMHGVTKPLSAPVTIVFVQESAETKKRASGNLATITAKFDVALKDHGVEGKAGVVGSKVGESIHIEATVYANSN